MALQWEELGVIKMYFKKEVEGEIRRIMLYAADINGRLILSVGEPSEPFDPYVHHSLVTNIYKTYKSVPHYPLFEYNGETLDSYLQIPNYLVSQLL